MGYFDDQGGQRPALSTEGHPKSVDPHFFERMLDIDVTQLPDYSNAFRDIYDEKLNGLIVRNVFPKEHMARVVERLVKQETPFPKTVFPDRFKAFFYGRALDGSDPHLSEYLRDATMFRQSCKHLFRDGPDFEERLEEVFRMMAGGRAVKLPQAPDGRHYTSATIRVLPEGGHIGTHCGNEASTRPAYNHLNTLIDRKDQISFFVTLQDPVEGGELIVYSFQFSQVDESMFDHGHTLVDHVLHLYQQKKYRPTAGDLLIFDGGRYFHKVDVVKGPRTRWTIGGFCMFSKDAGTLYYWS